MNDHAATSAGRSAASESLRERVILAFERAWRIDSLPCISQAIHGCEANAQAELARELALVDMEFRWQASARGRPLSDSLGGRPTWREYARHVPEIGDVSQIPPALVAEEYRVRQLWGDRPRHDRFISSYPDQLAALPKWLSRIDDELRSDGVNTEEPLTTSAFVPAPADPRAPLSWSDYLLQQHLSSGGFGKVYRALQVSLDRPVAVKALHKARQRDPQAVEQFIEEARLLARLKHPGVVGVHGLGRYPGGGYFLVLDLIEGENLQQWIDCGPMRIDDAVRITIAVAEAIQHAHDHGVVHGDLKPSNVLCDHDGEITVTDFGLGRLLPTGASDTAIARFRGGTLAYLAPEMARGGNIGIATDVYGLGALLYALLTGQPPHKGDRSEAIITRLETGHPVLSPTTIGADISPDLVKLVMKCLATDCAARYATAADVAAELSRCGTTYDAP
jgi:tRNA A-37 threonylcarbamoyl transferase component Bud32